MSASLVGSEMCIRDSNPHSAQGPSEPQSASIHNPPCRTCKIGCGVRAVSYTHLTLPTICSV
eukprot:13333408-Alexandrium_andersonii.AAC.1